MTLTAKAHSLVRPLHESLSRLDELLDTASFDPQTTQRRFRLSLSDYAARIVLPLVVRRPRIEAPGIELAISQVSREAMLSQLIDGELDLALGIFPNPPEGVEVESLFEERFISIVDEGTMPEGGRLPLGEWLARPHARIALRPDVKDEIDTALQLLELKRHISITLPHAIPAIEFVKGTDLILTCASRAFVGVIETGSGLKRFDLPLPVPSFVYQQAWHKRKSNDPAHAWLRELVLDASRTDAPHY